METWKGTARLTWYRSGRLVGEELASFSVECTGLTQDDRLTPDAQRRGVTLQLVCAEARKRYGAPPRKVDIRVAGDDFPEGLDRARWRMDSGDFCYGTGILRVAPPSPQARLTNLKIEAERVDGH